MTPLFNDFLTEVFGEPSIARNATLRIIEQQITAEMLAEKRAEREADQRELEVGNV